MGIFFFQAEDGIRDGHVTGVQTCALPISDDVQDQRDERAHAPTLDSAVPAHQGAGSGWAGREIWAAPAPVHTGAVTGRDYPGRSEERRVGKECRSGGRTKGSEEMHARATW